MLHDLMLAIWFMLPAALANAAPVLAGRLPVVSGWDAPVDGGRTFRGRPLLGSHKTWRGLVSGVLMATLVLWLQQLAFDHTEWGREVAAGIPYDHFPMLVLGPLMGLGALGGDMLKSFFKRRHGTRAGGSWFPFDQLDYVLGAILVSLPFVVLSFRQYALMLIFWCFIHVALNYAGWTLGIRPKPV